MKVWTFNIMKKYLVLKRKKNTQILRAICYNGFIDKARRKFVNFRNLKSELLLTKKKDQRYAISCILASFKKPEKASFLFSPR